MKKKYFFILGNHPALSAAELSAVFPDQDAEFIEAKLASGAAGIFLMSTATELNAPKLIADLGGTVKIGRLTGEAVINDRRKIFELTGGEVGRRGKAKSAGGKFNFGFSYYGRGGAFLKPLAMEIKKSLGAGGVSSRWVTSREPVLSSVVVEQNRLVKDGVEIVMIENQGNLLIGETLAVQPFKELSFRDYGRPARDDRSGMLPPKIAQAMVNLARVKPGDTILDPFCGSGTILTEAMLMGYRQLVGADFSAKAVADTNSNIEWTRDKFGIRNSECGIYTSNVLDLAKIIKPKTIDAVITEPYLGPQRGRIDYAETAKELEALYSQSLAVFRKLIKPAGRVVMAWPVFRASRIPHRVSPDLGGFKIINPIPAELRQNRSLFITDRDTLLYGRPGQKVWREIVILSSSPQCINDSE